MDSTARVYWLTGLPGAGKTTIGRELAGSLRASGRKVEFLDGDDIRELFPNTGFSKEARNDHIKRIGFMAGLLERNGISVVASFVSPFREARQYARESCNNFIEIYLSTPIEECIKRDPKGMYAKAMAGEIVEFTGISSPYEVPENPELEIDTTDMTPSRSLSIILDYLKGADGK